MSRAWKFGYKTSKKLRPDRLGTGISPGLLETTTTVQSSEFLKLKDQGKTGLTGLNQSFQLPGRLKVLFKFN